MPTALDASELAARGARLRLDAAVAEAVDRFSADGLHALLLKGASLDAWLYPDDSPRLYGDGDLLIAPDDLEAAHHSLSELGYKRTFDDRAMPTWWREPGSAWFRAGDGVTIDVHRNLFGVRVDDEAAWRLLSRGSAVVPVAGRQVPALGLSARAMHVVLHAAQHGGDVNPPIADLERAFTVGDDTLWRDAAELARQLDALDAFTAGLNMTHPGQRLAARLRIVSAPSVDAALRATTPPPVALGLEQLARANGIGARLEIVWRKLVPPAVFIRRWDPRARGGRVQLAIAYLRRPLWILRHALPGFKAWYRTRRRVESLRRI